MFGERITPVILAFVIYIQWDAHSYFQAFTLNLLCESKHKTSTHDAHIMRHMPITQESCILGEAHACNSAHSEQTPHAYYAVLLVYVLW